MFDDVFARLPQETPRSPALLPGLRFGSLLRSGFGFFPLGFVAMFTLFPLVIMLGDPHLRLMIGSAVTTAGHVVAVDNDGGCGRRLTYAFTLADGPEYRGTIMVGDRSADASLKSGDSIAVRYLAGSPQINSAGSANSDGEMPLAALIFFPLMGILFFGPFFVPQIRQALRARRLMRTGVIIKGTVTFVTTRSTFTWPGISGGSSNNVYVSFRAPDGRDSEAKVRCDNTWLTQHLPPGTLVHIAHKPGRPRDAVLLDAYVR